MVAHALYADRFGNVALDLDPEDLAAGLAGARRPLEVRAPDGRFEASWTRHLRRRRPRGAAALRGLAGRMALAVNGGSAAGLLDLSADDEVELTPAL